MNGVKSEDGITSGTDNAGSNGSVRAGPPANLGTAPSTGSLAGSVSASIIASPAVSDATPALQGTSSLQAVRAEMLENTHRIDVDALMSRLRTQVGPHWDQYRDALTHFLTGKLSRQELVRDLNSSLGTEGLKYHNYLVLTILANACRELPPGISSNFSGWARDGGDGSGSSGRPRMTADASIENLYREILSLSVRERRRIKQITPQYTTAPPTQPGRPAMRRLVVPPPLPAIVATRQAVLPRIPFAQDQRDRRPGSREPLTPLVPPGSAGGVSGAGSGEVAGLAPGSVAVQIQAPPKGKKRRADDSQSGLTSSVMQQVDKAATPTPTNDAGFPVHPGRSSGPLTWTQDIIHGFDVPLASESYEMPTDESVGTRMLGIALEHGLVDGIEAGTTDFMLASLEVYLQSTMQRLATELKHRRITAQHPLGASDLDLFALMRPTELHDLSAPLYRLRTEFLRDEPSVRPAKRRAYGAPLELPTDPPAVDTETETEEAVGARAQHDEGVHLVSQLLDMST